MADQEMYGDLAPKFAPFLGMAGIAFAMIFGCTDEHIEGREETYTEHGTQAIGAAYGTAKSGIGIAGVGTFRSDLIMKVCLRSSPFLPRHFRPVLTYSYLLTPRSDSPSFQ